MYAGGVISAKDLTDEVWDFIFLDGKLPSSSRIPEDVLHKMRREFISGIPSTCG